MDLCDICEGPAILEVKQRSNGWHVPNQDKPMYQLYQGKLSINKSVHLNTPHINIVILFSPAVVIY